MTTFEYKGYVGSVEYDPEFDELYGRVFNLHRDGMTFVGKTLEAAEREFRISVDAYLNSFAGTDNLTPETPDPHEFKLWLPLHVLGPIAAAALRERKSIEDWVTETLLASAQRRDPVGTRED